MQLIESILYDCVYHSAPIILCVLLSYPSWFIT